MNNHDIPFEGLAIGGARVASADGRTAPALDPSNNRVLAQVAQATAEDVDRAVKLAHDRFYHGAWKQIRTRERGQILQRIANLIRERQEMLAQIESRNGGKPISAARGEIGAVANTFEY
ncbi:aldehyde dehydrogenase family protein, partial [Anaerolineae bacterium CFX9]|nr:aldehyde dehydrogenase family protein [Anaerolineae bacterium CFX9]